MLLLLLGLRPVSTCSSRVLEDTVTSHFVANADLILVPDLCNLISGTDRLRCHLCTVSSACFDDAKGTHFFLATHAALDGEKRLSIAIQHNKLLTRSHLSILALHSSLNTSNVVASAALAACLGHLLVGVRRLGCTWYHA